MPPPPPDAEIEYGLATVPAPVIVMFVPFVIMPEIVETAPAVRPDAVPVRLVATPDAGVPRVGFVNVGEVNVLLVNV